jgi:hypothetical protein
MNFETVRGGWTAGQLTARRREGALPVEDLNGGWCVRDRGVGSEAKVEYTILYI